MVEDPDNAARHEVARIKEPARPLVEVHALLEELPCDDAKVSLRRLVDRQCVVEEGEVDHEPPFDVFRLRLCELCGETEDLPIVVVELVEVLPWHLRDQM